MLVNAGSTDVTTYFQMRLTAGGDGTGLTITDFDLSYTRSGAAAAAKVDATALVAADSAHGDNKMLEVNSTDCPGLYRVDWPDAAFASGVGEVVLTVKHASCFTESLRVELDAPVNVAAISGDQTAADNAESFFDGTGYAGTGNVIPTVTTLTGHTAQTGDSFSRLGAPAGASVSADVAAVKTDTGNLITRITSTLFSGITSLAEWLGLIAGKQAGDATALTEIKATGAGAGTYDPTTDSTEALRDHVGDGTSLTEAGGTGNHLTAVPWNAAWDAEVQSEAADALTAYAPNTVVPDAAGTAPTAAEIKTAIEAAGSHLTLIKAVTDAQAADGAGLSAIPDLAGVTTLLARLSAARAGYLDELAAANLPADIDQIKGDLPVRLSKNTAHANFMFKMVNDTDGYTAETGITVTEEVSIDGAAFTALTNAFTEVASGWYKINLAAADLNGDVIVLRFTGTGCRATEFVIITQST